MKIFDTHSHYNLEPFFSPQDNLLWQKSWQQSQAHGVVGSVVVGTTFQESSVAVQIAESDVRLGAAIGIHPMEYNETAANALRKEKNEASAYEDALADVATDIEELRLILHPQKVVAIGETGLDYYHFDGYTAEEIGLIKKVQQMALAEHVKLASSNGLPVLLHVRDREEAAYWKVLEVLKEQNYTGQFVLHCVSGPLKYVEAAIEMGAYVSIAGNVTYKSADQIRAIVQITPKDRLLAETDAPFLPPVPYRGKLCEPWMIEETVKYLESEMNISPDQLLENSYRLFPTLQPTA